MRLVFTVLFFFTSIHTAFAIPLLDQDNSITQSVGGRVVYAGNSPAQSFTANAEGLLSKIEVMIQRDAGDIGDLSLEIWSMVAGAPAGSTPLFSTPMDLTGMSAGSYDYVTVDVSAGMIGLNHGDQYTIALNGSAGLSDPNVVWNRGRSDYLGGVQFDRSGSWRLSATASDYGFRTYVDPDIIPAGLIVVPEGDYNGDAYVNSADYTVWRDSLGQSENQMPADGNHDGQVDQDDYHVWTSAFGLKPDSEVANGSFASGDLSDWDVIVGPNTNVSFGFPRVETFDVDGDGTSNDAMRLRLGRINTDLFGGSVTIQQKLLLEEDDYEFSANIASQSLEAFSNNGPGNYLLKLDGEVIDQIVLQGTSIDAGEVIRDSIFASIEDVTAGYHTLSITVERGATNSRAIYQFIDDIQLNRIGSTSSLATLQAIPEPSGFVLFSLAYMSLIVGRKRQWRIARAFVVPNKIKATSKATPLGSGTLIASPVALIEAP